MCLYWLYLWRAQARDLNGFDKWIRRGEWEEMAGFVVTEKNQNGLDGTVKPSLNVYFQLRKAMLLRDHHTIWIKTNFQIEKS